MVDIKKLIDEEAYALLQKAREGKLKKRIADIKVGEHSHITLDRVKVIRVSPIERYRAGIYRKMEVADDTAKTTVIAFNKNVEELKRLKAGDIITIRNVSVKEGTVFLDGFSVVEIMESAHIYSVEELPKQWNGKPIFINVHGRIAARKGRLYLVDKGKGIALYWGKSTPISSDEHPLMVKHPLKRGREVILLDAWYSGEGLHIVDGKRATRILVAKAIRR